MLDKKADLCIVRWKGELCKKVFSKRGDFMQLKKLDVKANVFVRHDGVWYIALRMPTPIKRKPTKLQSKMLDNMKSGVWYKIGKGNFRIFAGLWNRGLLDSLYPVSLKPDGDFALMNPNLGLLRGILGEENLVSAIRKVG